MDVIRKSKQTGDEQIVTMETAIDRTEGCGYCDKDTVKVKLLNGQEVETPYAIYKLK